MSIKSRVDTAREGLPHNVLHSSSFYLKLPYMEKTILVPHMYYENY